MGIIDDVSDVGTEAYAAADPVIDPLGIWDERGAVRSISRQFDDETGGGFADLSHSGDQVKTVDGDGTAHYNNRYLEGENARLLYDTVFSYDGTLNGMGDSADVLGPTVGEAADYAIQTTDEADAGEERATLRMIGYALAAMVALYLLAPVLELLAALAGD